jgi:Ricin-type beta-trefoil lectin domain/Vacuolar protein sorting-associated protein 62
MNTTLRTVARRTASLRTLLALTALGAGLTPAGCSQPAESEPEDLGATRQPLTAQGQGTISIRSSGRCVDVSGGSAASGTPVIQWDCTGTQNQMFEAVYQDDGSFMIKAQHSGKCLDVQGASTAGGAPVIQWDCLGGANQKFTQVWQEDGSYLLKAKHSNKCLDVNGGSTANGVTLIQWDCAGSPNQRFNVGDQIYAALARRYAPKIWLHSEEIYFPSSVEYYQSITTPATVGGEQYLMANGVSCSTCSPPNAFQGWRPAATIIPVYAEIVHRTQYGQGQNQTDVVYWMFYPYNGGKDVCMGLGSPSHCFGGVTNLGSHFGDWEHLTIRFSNGVPQKVYLSQHTGGTEFDYGSEDLKLDNGRPTVFAALNSHALYEEADSYDVSWAGIPLANISSDHTDHGSVWDTGLSVQTFIKDGNYTAMPWLNYLGHWGNPHAGYCDSASDECQLDDGPASLLTRPITDPETRDLE